MKKVLAVLNDSLPGGIVFKLKFISTWLFCHLWPVGAKPLLIQLLQITQRKVLFLFGTVESNCTLLSCNWEIMIRHNCNYICRNYIWRRSQWWRTLKADFHWENFLQKENFVKCDWPAQIFLSEKKCWSWKFSTLWMIFFENFLSVEIFLEWKWALSWGLLL